uniref:Uncharacterized protein n=1 Tax=viral metagenome TaxID=1070528 RepID=A0A6C0B7C4_9ZZZZ
MKLTSPFKDFTMPEYWLFGLFIVYLVVPFQTPKFIHTILTNPIGLIFLLTVAAAMFFMTPMILAVLFVLVIYELIRRDGSDANSYRTDKSVHDNHTQQYKYVSDNIKNNSVHVKGPILNMPTESHEPPKQTKSESVYLSIGDSLEEVMVGQMAPTEYAATVSSSDFKPISENNVGGSVF